MGLKFQSTLKFVILLRIGENNQQVNTTVNAPKKSSRPAYIISSLLFNILL